MVELLKANNPNCFLVTGRPRTPRDQGSVENANKLVQRVLKSISAERRLKGLEVNWTNLLGQIMAVCNSQTGTRSLNTSSYEAVFGQRYHPVLRCTVDDMRGCVSIFQRLKLSPDERLEKYVKDHDIVDINDADALGCCNHQIIEEDSNDIDDANDDDACEATCFAAAGLDYCQQEGDNNGENKNQFNLQEAVECRRMEVDEGT